MSNSCGRLSVCVALICLGLGFTGTLKSQPLFETDGTVDHVSLLQGLGPSNYERGRQIYQNLCVNCHGSNGRTPSLPIARAFGVGPFKFGSDPYSLYQTLTNGNGLMGAQGWMTPEERYDVIHYIREAFMKPLYEGYEAIDADYLARFPTFEASDNEQDLTGVGSQRDYGGALASQLRVLLPGGKHRDHSSVLSVRLADGVTIAYDLHRLRQAGFGKAGFWISARRSI